MQYACVEVSKGRVQVRVKVIGWSRVWYWPVPAIRSTKGAVHAASDKTNLLSGAFYPKLHKDGDLAGLAARAAMRGRLVHKLEYGARLFFQVQW